MGGCRDIDRRRGEHNYVVVGELFMFCVCCFLVERVFCRKSPVVLSISMNFVRNCFGPNF